MGQVDRQTYEIVVVGAGHAGIEAALAASRMGCNTALLTMDPTAVGRMSCNPAIGGTAKGHLVREIDALGGEMGSLADATGIHFKMLNRSKGPAVWSPRCQNDREWYSREAGGRVRSQTGLSILQDTVEKIIVSESSVAGIVGVSGTQYGCRALVICSGTFLNALMHTGLQSTPGGRYREPASVGLSVELNRLGFRLGRLKTGTPPRIDLRSIDLGLTEVQLPDSDPRPFSFRSKRIQNRQIPMYLTYTNPETHSILREGFDESPLFTGRITGIGPRYCPSIEDKVNRFADKDRHQLFLEPEGYETDVVYMNGFSTSLPSPIQERAIRTVPGLKNARMMRPGYAVEYDFIPPHQLHHTLESKPVASLFFAGQINGTSGYEEAAGQGLIAGINAALKVRGGEPFILGRDEAYIGVMIDDLINKGTEEPYRVFTSRAEYRLLLRQDNADSRLMRRGFDIGLVPSDAIARLDEKERKIAAGKSMLGSTLVKSAEANLILDLGGSTPVSESQNLAQLLRRPGVTLRDILATESMRETAIGVQLLEDNEAAERLEIEVKYDGYLSRQQEQIEVFARNESLIIPEAIDYSTVRSLSREGRERLDQVRPVSIGQASRISGVTPADISILMVSLCR